MKIGEFNTRVIVIDDDETIRDSFREILTPKHREADKERELHKLGAELFDDQPATPEDFKRSTATFEFDFSEASNGKDGVEKIRAAIASERPYAAAFVDMRMPGWDGLETVRRIREIDERVEIVFVTAFSDHSVAEIVETVGANISYHCKPFATEEIEQIATKAVYEWNRERNLESLINIIAQIRAQNWQMKPLLNNILQQVAALLGSDSALIARKNNNHFEALLAIGTLMDPELALKYLASLPDNITDMEMYQNSVFAYFSVEKYGILAIFETQGKLNKERVYLIRLFLEQAAMAIENVTLHEELLRKEKLSAVGQAISMIAHDLRNNMSGIEMAVNMMLDSKEPRNDQTELLTLIGKRAQDGLSFVGDILDFTANAAAKKQPLTAMTFLQGLREKTDVIQSRHDIPIEVKPVKTDFPFLGDPRKLQRAITNLVGNAEEMLLEFPTPSPKVIVETEDRGETIAFTVSDNGPGIPRDIRDKLFLPFITSGKSGGTGLGLAIVKQFSVAHGGDVRILDAPRGATFEIAIPKC